MDSSFLTWIHISLGLFACLQFLKIIIQFGLPNHPARLIAYVTCLSTAVYFSALALTDLNLLSPWIWMKWRALPLIAGSLSILLQSIIFFGGFPLIYQKVMARVPVMAALLCFAFFPLYADTLSSLFLLVGGLFLIISVKKDRHLKRLYLKFLFMFSWYLILMATNNYTAYVLAQLILFLTLFYIFLFEKSVCLTALVDDYKASAEGESR